MFQRVILTMAIVLIATACGGGEATVATGPPPPRQLPAPDLGDETGGEGVNRVTGEGGSSSIDDPCAAMIDGLTSEAGQALSEALGTPDEGPLMLATFGGFGPEGEALAARMADFTGPDATAESAAAFLPYLDELDALTLEPCGVPAGMAYAATNAAMSVVSFACVDAALSEGSASEDTSEPCGETARFFPTSLPCFERTGETWVGAGSTDTWPWVSVDCASGEPVRWDQIGAEWVVVTTSAQEAFETIDEAIG